jgi:hypothetical protein
MYNNRCLKKEEIVDYLEDRLTDDDRTRAERHLSECDACLEELMVFNGIVRSGVLSEFDPVPEEVTQEAINSIRVAEDYPSSEKLLKVFKKWISKYSDLFANFFSWRNMRLSPIRGSRRVVSEDLVLIRKPFADFNAEIEIEKTGHGRARIDVMVTEKNRANPIRVTLLKNKREVSSYLTNGSNAVFEDMPFDHYLLLFTRNGAKVGEYLFEIKESRNG